MQVARCKGSGLRISVGTGSRPAPGWISSEIEFLDLLDESTWNEHFSENSIDAILAEHVWEHLEPADGLRAAKTCYRYLRPGGYLRLAVPDGNHTAPGYLEAVAVGGTGPGADDHRVLYTAESLTTMLQSAGFIPRPLEFFDEQGSFCEVPWSPKEGLIRRSRRFDPRNASGELRYTSLIVDAVKLAHDGPL